MSEQISSFEGSGIFSRDLHIISISTKVSTSLAFPYAHICLTLTLAGSTSQRFLLWDEKKRPNGIMVINSRLLRMVTDCRSTPRGTIGLTRSRYKWQKRLVAVLWGLKEVAVLLLEVINPPTPRSIRSRGGQPHRRDFARES
jgi:hypothetical protein